MRLQNYLSDLIDDEEDISVRVCDFGHKFKQDVWFKIQHKNRTLRNLKILKRNFYQYLNNSRTLPISIMYKICKELSVQEDTNFTNIWNKIFDEVRYFKSESSKSKKIKIPKTLSEDLAYFVGALRDGCLITYSGNKNHFGLAFTQESCPEWLEDTIIPITKKLFGISIKPRKQIYIYNKIIFRFFERIFEHPPGNQGMWKTPTIFRHAPRKIQLSYVQGFFDAEGICSKTDYRLGFVQNNRESLVFIKNTLEKEGIKSGSVLRDRNTHVFWICAKDSVIRFIDRIGSRHPKRQKTLKMFSSTLIRRAR